jgi:hypothetical protein
MKTDVHKVTPFPDTWMGGYPQGRRIVSGEDVYPENDPPPLPVSTNKMPRQFTLDDGTVAEIGVTLELVAASAEQRWFDCD